MQKYSEEIIRHRAVTGDGKPREILERITCLREVRADGSLSLPVVAHRRFDLATGECLNQFGESEFEDDGTGDRLRLQIRT